MPDPIHGEITFHERNGLTVATVSFDAVNVRFHVVADRVDLGQAIMGMVADHERVRSIMGRAGCLDWGAMEEACHKARRG